MKVLILSLCFILCASAVCPSLAQTRVDKRLSQIENEKNKLQNLKNPADRAESLMKIAQITLTFAQDSIAANDIPAMASSVSEYTKAVTDARDAMMNSGFDAYKKPKGYQTIEMATRAHLRILTDFSRQLSPADRRPLEEAIETVSKIRDEIVHVLFS